VTQVDDHLKLQLDSLGVVDVYPQTKEKFFLKHSFDSISFTRDEKGDVKKLQFHHAYAPLLKAVKTDKPLPSLKEGIVLPPEILAPYVGVYDVPSMISFEVTLEDGRLFVKPSSDDDKSELFAESQTDFFLKVVVARVQFEMDPSGKVSGLKFEQGKMQLSAVKMK
jgi:hypothetical protein